MELFAELDYSLAAELDTKEPNADYTDARTRSFTKAEAELLKEPFRLPKQVRGQRVNLNS